MTPPEEVAVEVEEGDPNPRRPETLGAFFFFAAVLDFAMSSVMDEASFCSTWWK